ncbi:MAG: hypothetical protein RIG26_17835 [Thalassospira sp.]|uniref:hypothetical protein n=1 Tax=Thalassospira sp. TaxID=1912094 RepID=UPI0032EBE432
MESTHLNSLETEQVYACCLVFDFHNSEALRFGRTELDVFCGRPTVFPMGLMLHLEDSAGDPSFVSEKTARSSRGYSKRLIVRRWTKNCEPPIVGLTFVKAAHTKTAVQTPRQFFCAAG